MDQLVKSCDLLVGLFWTRVGTHTGVAEGGTVEEVEYFISQKKPVMLYFSSAQIDPTKIDIEQFQNLRSFQERMRNLGLVEGYTSTADFRERFARHLTLHINRLATGAPPPRKDPEQVAELMKKLKEGGGPYIEDYVKDGEIKSFLVKGDTRDLKAELKRLGGVWRPRMGGWLFPKTKELEVASLLKGK